MIYYAIISFTRNSLGQQLQLALAKADSEHLARTIAEGELSEAEKQKTMLQLELKEVAGRNKSELNKKDITISTVSNLYNVVEGFVMFTFLEMIYRDMTCA